MSIQSDIQALYIAYFNRPADFLGLQYWEEQVAKAGGNVAAVADAFAASPEYTSLYEDKSSAEIIDTIYDNLFGRPAEPDAISYWGTRLDNGTFTIGNIANSILVGAQNADKEAIENKKVAAQAFYDSLDTTAEIKAYEANSAAVRDWLKGITTDESLTAATTATALAALTQEVIAGGAGTGTTFDLTIGVDTLPGTAANDTFNATVTADGFTLGSLDSIDGGSGNDALVITDQKGGSIVLGSATVKNVESLTIRSGGDFAVSEDVVNNELDITGWTGLTRASIELTSTDDVKITAGTDTAITLTDKGDANTTIEGGGGAIVVNTKGNATVGGTDANAYTSVTITGAAEVNVTDNSGASKAVGTKLTTVTLDGITAASTVTGKGVTTLNLANIAGQDVTLVNETAKHALTLNLDAVVVDDNDTDEVTTDDVYGIVTDAAATSVTINATDDSAIVLAAEKATTLTVAGAGDLTLVADANADATADADYSALTTVTFTGSGKFTADLSGATELASVNSSTGTGTLDVTIAGTNGAETPAAQSVTGGAGDDKVTITGTLGKGSTLSLGAGSDTVAFSGDDAQILAAAVVDAGAGVDTLSLTVVDASNVGAFKNFEQFDVAGAAGQFDQDILDAKNNVTGFVGTAAAAAGAELLNLGANVGFTVLGTMGTEELTLTQATAGAITITSNVDAEEDDGLMETTAAFITNATSATLVFNNDNVDEEDNTAALSLTGTALKTVAITSGGSEVVNSATVSGDDTLTGITVTGAQHLELTATITGDTNKLTSVDASAATGGVTVTLNELAASATVKLGSGDDIINLDDSVTSTTFATVNAAEKAANNEQTEQSNFDVFALASAVVAENHEAEVAGAYSIEDGLYTLGTGATTLGEVLTQLATNVEVNGAVVFTFGTGTYLYAAGETTEQGDDAIIKLTGTTGIDGLGALADGQLYLVG
ncbi:DUF4214 domain-containing protein [Pseudoduganella umbonata]|uniref:DUF4214 domain-containing protein n=1 Tax=Pseudoduganella umbonata TaxID=864828 RepID=A0A4P8HT50_9BURK|nr:DUF4214 domain-containing protein [Pseudoduganella umbonata]MBB3220865.1 hypothetical protein [Pseudoduganella umbonata]QCP11674.1 DUF4214 domain-containing protein [Pseudoduganella umbonata]